MQLPAALAAALAICLGASPAFGDIRIHNDPGGRILEYANKFAALRQSGERVVIDGACLSACTMVLGAVSRDRICVTPRATLGFHAAWLPTPYGSIVRSPLGNQVLWQSYPRHIRNWINRNGGLTQRMIYLRGPALAALYPSCT